MATPVFRITSKDGGMGSFLCPPGDPMLRYSIMEKSSDRWNARIEGSYALDTTSDWIPEGIRRRAAAMLAAAERVESPGWVGMVYGYFRNMYAPDGASWANVRDLVSGAPGAYPDEWHAAVVFIRKYFPDHEVRADLIRDPGKGYGSYPCVHCGRPVQYSAHHDALVIYPNGTECVEGKQHSH
jgi:hypothetical protein